MDGLSPEVNEKPKSISEVLEEKEKALRKLRDKTDAYSLHLDNAPTSRELKKDFVAAVGDFVKINSLVPCGLSIGAAISLESRRRFGCVPAEVTSDDVLREYAARYEGLWKLAREIWPVVLAAQYDDARRSQNRRSFALKRKPWTKRSAPVMPLQRIVCGYNRLRGRGPQL